MALQRYTAGEDINFNFKRLISGTTDQYRNLDNYIDIYIYVSQGIREIKFSKNAKTGYTTLVRVDAYTYRVQLSSANTRYLARGDIRVKTNMVSTDMTIEDQRFNRIAGGLVFTLVPDKIGDED